MPLGNVNYMKPSFWSYGAALDRDYPHSANGYLVLPLTEDNTRRQAPPRAQGTVATLG